MESKTHFFHGHEMTPENVGKNGRCKICAKAWRDSHKPEGLGTICECGCGKYAGLYAQSHPNKDQIKGQPKRFLPGHGGHGSLDERQHIRETEAFCKKGHLLSLKGRYDNGTCKQCHADNAAKRKEEPEVRQRAQEATAKWKRENAKHVAELNATSHRQRRYGLSPERFAEMLVKQNNKCAVCPVVFTFEDRETTPCVDHDHTCCSSNTSCGKCVRGLVCHHCNAGLGSFRDNTVTLQNAIQYLKETTQRCQKKLTIPFVPKENPTPMVWVKPSFQTLYYSRLGSMV